MATLEDVTAKIAQRTLDFWKLNSRESICLDGDFSLEDLEYIIACMRAGIGDDE
ncbi:hypothetical protein ISG18_12620 [Burkholderia pseudomallei]|nr:hypothetical protein [Burkholderia pseudomallei]